MWSLGIDIGGTFTDIVARGEERTLARKVLTTHDDPARGVGTGVAGILADARIDPGAVETPGARHNPLHQHAHRAKGGVHGSHHHPGVSRHPGRSVRERKYELYDLAIAKPPPLVPRDRRLEATERVGANGEVLERLDSRSLDEAMSELARHKVDAVAIAFLHAYANPEHERAARARLSERFPELSFAISSEVAPEIREFERISTTVANAYLMPLAARYVGRLAERLAGRGIRCRPPPHALERRAHRRRGGAAVPGCGCWSPGPAAGGHRRRMVRCAGRTRRPARIRHGRHDGQALPRRRRGTARHSRVRGLPGTPLHRRERAAAQDLGPRAHRDRSGRGAASPAWTSSDCSRQGRKARAPSPDLRATDSAAGSRRSPTPTSCWATSIRRSSPGGDMRLRPDAAATALASLEAGSGTRRSRACPGNLRGSHRDHGERRAGPHRRAWDATPVATCCSRRAGRALSMPGTSPRGSESSASSAPPSAGVRLRPRAPAGRPGRADRVATVAESLARLDWDRFEATYRRIEEEWPVGAGRTPDWLPKPPASSAPPTCGFRGQDFEIVVELPAGTVHAGFRGSHRGCVPGGLRAGLLPGAAGSRDRGGQRPGRGARGGRRQGNRDDRR